MTKTQQGNSAGHRRGAGAKPREGRVRKSKAKRKSIHANTFEERQENRRKKEELKAKKEQRKEWRAIAKVRNNAFISDIVSWAKNNPIHPSTVPAPKQEGLQPTVPLVERTFKAMIRKLPLKVTAKQVDDHFFKRGVNINCIRLLMHRKTGKCLGQGFLEFKKRVDYEKALNLNLSIFRKSRILVEGSLRNLLLSNRRPKKIISYTPPLRDAPMDIEKTEPNVEVNEETNNAKDVEIVQLE